MNAKRKIQLGAATVIANGLLALSLAAPNTALANPCSPWIKSFPASACYVDPAVTCQLYAPPGCTVTSATCFVFAGTNAVYVCRAD